MSFSVRGVNVASELHTDFFGYVTVHDELCKYSMNGHFINRTPLLYGPLPFMVIIYEWVLCNDILLLEWEVFKSFQTMLFLDLILKGDV